MKRILLLIMIAYSIHSFAQVTSMDETSLIGKWKVTSSYGKIKICGNSCTPTYIEFKDGDPSIIQSDVDYNYINTFFISNTDKLHLVLNHSYDGMDGSSTLNFIIQSFSANTMKLKSFSSSSYMILTKESTSNVKSFTEDSTSFEKYTIGGVKTVNPKGLYIENGKKFVNK